MLIAGRCSSLPFVYARAGYHAQGVFLLFGVAFGVVFQRSRFCLVRAFREPFMTGDAEHTRAAALALAVSTLGFAILKFTDLKDKGEWVFPGAGVGALAGGPLFGVGMTVAGGCGAGSIWRAGEGQVKLWAALVSLRARRLAHAAGRWCRRGARQARLGGVPAARSSAGAAPSCSSSWPCWWRGRCWRPGTRTRTSSACWNRRGARDSAILPAVSRGGVRGWHG